MTRGNKNLTEGVDKIIQKKGSIKGAELFIFLSKKKGETILALVDRGSPQSLSWVHIMGKIGGGVNQNKVDWYNQNITFINKKKVGA